jgi:hypothetical protein
MSASYLGSDDSPLLARWRRLKIDLLDGGKIPPL